MAVVKSERVVYTVAMLTGLARPRWLIGIAAPPTAAFILGFAAETASVDEFWRCKGLMIFGPLVLLLTAALAWALIIYGAGGAVLGAACGIAAWALRLALGQRRQAGGC